MKNHFVKKIKWLSIILFCFFVYGTLMVRPTFAKNKEPFPAPYVRCDETRESEWHSLRPYQASPCEIPIKEEEQSLLCGKDFVVKQKFVTNSASSFCNCPTPPPQEEGTFNVNCTCSKNAEFEISVNAFDSELPVAGNTELIGQEKTNTINQILRALEKEKRISEWGPHLPPDPSSYKNILDYYKDYQEWRGKNCVEFTIPIVNIVGKKVFFCFNNPSKPDYWAALFPYIPYSSTEDRIGKISLSDFTVKQLTPGLEIKNLKTEWRGKTNDIRNKGTGNNEAVLFFPHMVENAELLSLLQSTFVPKESLNNKNAQEIKEDDILPAEQVGGCKILNTRYNPGDQLFGEQQNSTTQKGVGAPTAKVSYTASFECPARWIRQSSSSWNLQGQDCEQSITLFSTVETFTPLAEEIWSKAVAGNSSVFRKIYPKIGPNSPHEKIIDVPVSTSVEYVTAGENAITETQTPELYFPHLGGVYDYFLLGIQTALRPWIFPGLPSLISRTSAIPEADRANEYLSWYLNGTLFRAESDPLSHKEEEDLKRLTTFSGPLNKLLPQEIQWRNKITSSVLNSQRDETQKTGRVNEVASRVKRDRHDQIAACTLEVNLLGWIPEWVPIIGGGINIGGIPVACSEKTIASVGQNLSSSNDSNNNDPTGLCTSPPSTNGSVSGGATTGVGYCSTSFLSRYFDSADVEGASCICNVESGGQPNAINCGCLNGTSYDYSVGLFQINLLAHCDNGSPFEKDPPHCKILDTNKVIDCANNFFDPTQNAQKAAALAKYLKDKGYSPWCPWKNAAKACGLDVSNCP